MNSITWTTERTPFTRRFIGKCKVCKKGYRRDQRCELKREMRSDMIRPAAHSHTIELDAYPQVTCCGRAVQLQPIKGITNDHKCDAKCLNSKGHICECSCGGKNHGKNWE